MTDFEHLYRKYASDVYRFALYLSRDRAAAEDITSETFIRAWSGPDDLKRTTVKGFLFTIARNLFLQNLRNSARHTAESNEPRADSAASPERVAELKDELRNVLRNMRQLTEMDRAALLMSAVDGMDQREIASTLNLSLAAVKVKIHRARRKLR